MDAKVAVEQIGDLIDTYREVDETIKRISQRYAEAQVRVSSGPASFNNLKESNDPANVLYNVKQILNQVEGG